MHFYNKEIISQTQISYFLHYVYVPDFTVSFMFVFWKV